MSDDEVKGTAGAPKAVGAGRGLLFITAAKLWFMVAGFAIQFMLPSKRALGSPAKYGAWTIVLACVSLFNNVVITGTVQSVSRYVAQTPANAAAVIRAGLRRNVLVGAISAGIFILGAPFVSEYVLHDTAYTTYLRIAGIVIFCYSLYAVFVGAANGLRQFQKQAGLDISFATMRAALVVGAAVVTHSVAVSLGGFAAASVLILVASAAWVGMGGRGTGEPFAARELDRFFMNVAGYLALVNLLMFIDGVLLKRMVTIAAEGRGAADAAALGDAQAGLYGAVQTISRLPYQLILAVTFVIFPLISRASFEADSTRAKRYVEVTMRYSLVVVGLMAVVLAARPTAVMRLLFPAEYAVAAPAVPILVLGYVAFSLFNILGTILNGAGHTGASLKGGAATVAVCGAAVWGALRYALTHDLDPLIAAATATAISMAVGVVLAGAAVRKRFGAVIGLRTPLLVLVASAAALGVGRVWPQTGFLGGKVGTLVSLVGIGAIYLLFVSPELRPSELRKLRADTRG